LILVLFAAYHETPALEVGVFYMCDRSC
jgi:hypothetical protein